MRYIFLWFRHLIVKCEKEKHRLLIFFVIIPLIIKIIKKKNKKKKKYIRTQLLKI